MRSARKAMLAGAAAVALLGVAGWTAAEIKNGHVLDVRLPDGALAHIRYVGDTPPTVSIAAPPTALSIMSPPPDAFGPNSAFTALDRISQAMDRQAEAMLRDMAAQPLTPLAGTGLTQIDIAKLPPGARGFSMVSTLSGSNVCTRSVEYRSLGGGEPPHVVTHTTGSCSAEEKGPAATSGATAEAPRTDHAIRQHI